VIVVYLAGRGPLTLSAALNGPIKYLGGKLERFRIGFLANYGYFCKYTSIPNDDNVTFVQAYNAAAKMARPKQMSLLAISTLCRFYHYAKETQLRQSIAAAVQHTRDLTKFAEQYVRDRHTLRIEEVVTIDRQRVRSSIIGTLKWRGVFENDRFCSTTRALLRANLLIRLTNWSGYVCVRILVQWKQSRVRNKASLNIL